MANLILTSKCQRNCPYCFAPKKGEELNWNNFYKIAEFLSREPKMPYMNFLGGEPTLHPDYLDFLKFAVSEKFIVNTFTNGIIEESLLREIEELGSRTNWANFNFLINVNDAELRTEKEEVALDRTLKALHKASSIGYNIHDVDCDLNFLLDMMLKYRTQPTLRLGIAHPNKDKTNKFLTFEDCRKVRKAIVDITNKRRVMEANLVFDCGFPLCMFSEEDIGKLYLSPTTGINFGCRPAVDIFPDLTVAPCYPFVDERVNLLDFKNYAELDEYLSKALASKNCILEMCDKCWFLGRLCSGGCKAHRINKPPI